jgi:hypothetical protein
MPLLDLKTDLKSLKYGKDRPGGGDSGQPYQKVDINRIDSGFNRFRMTTFDDGLVRGGIVGAANASVVDTLRIGKFLTDLPKGPLWIVKQVGLQLSNPKLESRSFKTGIGFIDTIASAINKVGIGPTRTYNLGINTLAQVPVNALGIHFNRHGLLPVQDDTTKYLSVVQNNNLGTGTRSNKLPQNSTNRLLKYAAKLLPTSPPLIKPLGVLAQILSLIPGGSLFIKPQQQTIDEYIGGPGSVYGVGKTLIRRYDYTSNGINKQQPQEKGKVNYPGLLGVSSQYFQPSSTFVRDLINSSPFSLFTPLGLLGPQAAILTSTSGQVKEYNNIDLATPTNTPSQINQTAVTYTTPAIKKYADLKKQVDNQSNLVQSYYDGNVAGSYTGSIKTIDQDTTKKLDRLSTNFRYYGGKTLVQEFLGSKVKYNNTDVHNRETDANILSVAFRAINPFTGDINDKDRILFSAYMNGFKDNFDATWGDVNYTGRAESFYIYNKFKRSVSFNLQIPCFNKIELFIKHRALGQLASVTAGAYSSNNLLGGVLLKVNVGNYLVGEYAVLNSLSYDIPNDTAWDVSDDALLAMNINASFNLTIVHKKLPQYSATDGFFGYLPKPPIPNNINQDKKDAGFFISSDKVKLFTKD